MTDSSTLGATGTIVIMLTAVQQYAGFRGLSLGEAKEELVQLLPEARPMRTQPTDGSEGWRRRSRTHGVDINVHVDRRGTEARVVYVSVRPYKPRR